MLNFLNISKQNLTVIKEIPVNINAHFITDTSESWIFSHPKEEEGICEASIHYISAQNNKKMMMEQPLWRGYLEVELPNEEMKKDFFENICEPVIHVILNIHEKYKDISHELYDFTYGVLKKNNPDVREIVIDQFIYTEIAEPDDGGIE
ncbi:hypothetical protein EV214_102106 [Marinisporobacter balticus]|uniref:Uncharacterized protein n=1 Tax=Marinisporobacter balticus TaxID=2018667 RepID=A0A4R2L9F2_9FIRM|nr:hypothetical protein EV214_102106 [Marinisporobacter balticus]